MVIGYWSERVTVQKPSVNFGLNSQGRMLQARRGITDEVYRRCFNNVKWPQSRPEVKPEDGYQMQLLGLAQSLFAELSRKRDISQWFGSWSHNVVFHLRLPIGSREKQILHAQRSCPWELTSVTHGPAGPSTYDFLLRCFSSNSDKRSHEVAEAAFWL